MDDPRSAPRAPWLSGWAFPLALLLAALLLTFAVGKYPISPGQLVTVLWSHARGAPAELAPAVETVVLRIRLPRALAALLAGAALAAAGAAYQGVFRNPLVSPDILGVSSGAALGAVTGIFLSLPVAGIQGLAFAFGMGAVLLAYGLGAVVRGQLDQTLVLVLAGVIISSLMGAGVALLTYLADPYSQLPTITFWLMGSLSSATAGDVLGALPAVLGGLLVLALLRWRMNVLALGDDEARALGVNAVRVRLAIISAATLMTAAVVSLSGTIGWIGLIVPHMARMLAGPNFVRLLPTAAILGAAYLVLVDTVARTAFSTELPLGFLNALLGAPFFLYLLSRARHTWQ